MKSIYLAIAGAVALAGLGVIAYKKRDYIRSSFTMGQNKVSGLGSRVWGRVDNAARSTAGRVANAARDLTHTERDPQTIS